MGIGTPLLIIFFCMTVALYMVGERPLISQLFTADEITGKITVTFSNILETLSMTTLVVGGVSVAVGIYGFVTGNPWAIFLGVAIFLISWAILPLGFLTDPEMPFQIKLMFGGGLSLMWSLAIISWYRGTEL